ncbi:MAG TPA: hypothetical protein DCY13_24815, partial [Verrucomicrobiales bacterium]|nr:hypothetical protein [Verrucomicrobiales bacterium]
MKSIRYKFRHFITSNRRPHVRRIRITAGGVRAARDPAGLATPKAGLRLAAGAFLLAAFLTAGPAIAASVDVEVTVENLAPANGTYLTPFWAGFHDGTFDTYNQGSPASTGLERLAEDGDTGPLSADFTASATGATQGTLNAIGPIPPGGKVSKRFSLDPQSSLARYFSYASMIIPSNDAFVANGKPTAHQIFDAGGGFLGADFVIQGSAVLDAGTEVNDELPANTAFFGQSAPDTGTAQGGNVDAHPGFNAAGSGGILDDPMFSAADFLAPNHQVARIRVTLLPPKPASVAVKIENLSPAAGTYLTPVW